MNTFRPRDQQGSWGPQLRTPMPAPLSGVGDSPLVHLCFNSAWLPSVLTSLKLLTRPESWQGSQADVQAAVQGAHDLMGAWEDGCSLAPTLPNWWLDFSIAFGKLDLSVWNEPDVIDNGDGTADLVYEAVVFPLGIVPPDITFFGRRLSDDALVGGHFSKVTVENQLDPSGQTYSLTITDCLGVSSTDSNFTPREYPACDCKSYRFVTGNTTTYTIRLHIRGNWLCGPA